MAGYAATSAAMGISSGQNLDILVPSHDRRFRGSIPRLAPPFLTLSSPLKMSGKVPN